MRCPKCNLRNTDRTVKCSCGYNFLTKTMGDDKTGNEILKKPNGTILALGWITSIIGGPIGVVIGFLIGFGKDKNTGNYIYDEKSRKTGKIMLVVAICMMVLGFVLGKNQG